MPDIVEGSAFAEARNVLVLCLCALVAVPGKISLRDRANVAVGQFAMDAINQRPQLAGVDEQSLTGPPAESAVPLAAGDDPPADEDLLL